MVDVTDPGGLAPGGVTVTQATLFVMSRMDGRHTAPDIQAEFLRRHGTFLFSDELDRMIGHLDHTLLLESPRFEAHCAELVRQYRAAPARPLRDPDSLGSPPAGLPAYLDAMLNSRTAAEATADGRLLGLIAPHLDYARGAPCYAAAYRDLARRTDARRFVILGTNHFGQSRSVVGTRKDFDTPFGAAPYDADFMRRLDQRCGADLCEREYDHAREHSVELQVVLLKHVLQERPFTIAPYLCPDACGPTGTAPSDGRGVDLRVFASALRAEIEASDVPTCIIAGADLSHVGRYFQDDRDLNADVLHAVEASDRRALDCLLNSDPEAFRTDITLTDNATNICSAGCTYVLASVLSGRARPKLLHYHQALTREIENCVTCAAIEFTSD
jgi:AmmeMemoRadiSam system protein B